jgi:glycosyltransferase involved in cell wall biosynthesis
MKIFIYYQTTTTPFGGANQFIRLLTKALSNQGLLADSIESAEVILFNSHLKGAGLGEVFTDMIKLKYLYPKKIFIHRVDGPVDLYRGVKLWVDSMLYRVNRKVVDGTIYQSNWSYHQNLAQGMTPTPFNTIIINCADKTIFSKLSSKPKYVKTRIIATSYSLNQNKGFDIYQYLDDHLDFSKYTMTFIGNSPVKFKHIIHKHPMTSKALAEALKHHHIYITASIYDPCSNSLIEALSTGLPVVARKSGGHPEIVGQAGVFFTTPEEALVGINTVAQNLSKFQKKIHLPDIHQTAIKYSEFAANIFNQVMQGKYQPKTISLFEKLSLLSTIYAWKLLVKIKEFRS